MITLLCLHHGWIDLSLINSKLVVKLTIPLPIPIALAATHIYYRDQRTAILRLADPIYHSLMVGCGRIGMVEHPLSLSSVRILNRMDVALPLISREDLVSTWLTLLLLSI